MGVALYRWGVMAQSNSSSECDALGVTNNPNPWTENSQWCD